MAGKSSPRRRKRRTREHVIADLSINFVERQVLLCGNTVERIQRDYGLDLILFTYDAEGLEERGPVFLQVKATDAPATRSGGDKIAVRVERADLRSWLDETMPVILVAYDARADAAYWLYVQAFFERQPARRKKWGATVTLYVSRSNVLDGDAVRRFRRFKDDVRAQSRGVIRHHE